MCLPVSTSSPFRRSVTTTSGCCVAATVPSSSIRAMPPGRSRARAGRAAAGRDPDHASPRRPSGGISDLMARAGHQWQSDRLPSLSQASRMPWRAASISIPDRCRIHGAFRSRPYDRPSGVFQRSASFSAAIPCFGAGCGRLFEARRHRCSRRWKRSRRCRTIPRSFAHGTPR